MQFTLSMFSSMDHAFGVTCKNRTGYIIQGAQGKLKMQGLCLKKLLIISTWNQKSIKPNVGPF